MIYVFNFVVLFFFFFFFQAEDGIRDADVTGVQTCALPICLIVSCKLAQCILDSSPLTFIISLQHLLLQDIHLAAIFNIKVKVFYRPPPLSRRTSNSVILFREHTIFSVISRTVAHSHPHPPSIKTFTLVVSNSSPRSSNESLSDSYRIRYKLHPPFQSCAIPSKIALPDSTLNRKLDTSLR